jgi:hypothetical protein
MGMMDYNLAVIAGGAFGVFCGIQIYDFIVWAVPKMQAWAADR